VAQRVDDDDVMRLLKIMLKANGRCGVPTQCAAIASFYRGTQVDVASS